MRTLRLLSLVIATFLFSAVQFACADDSNTPEYTFPDPEKPAPEQPESGYPAGLTVTGFSQTLGDKVCKGFVAIADLKANPKLKFNAVHLPAPKKPTQIHSEFTSKGKGKPHVTINAGYWWAGTSLSLLITDGDVKSIENQTVTRKNSSDQDVVVYPVRSSFGQTQSGTFETAWIYCVLDNGNKPYSFPSALGNDERTKVFMAAPPTSTTAGGSLWTPREAVGGGPMLVSNSQNIAVDNYWKEVFDGGGIAGTSRQPRTAIGATADGKLVLLVCDGRNMNGSAGYTLAELADKLISLGVVNAINLDGGGSSTIVGTKGSVLNRPSDTADKETIVERNISTAVVISLTE